MVVRIVHTALHLYRNVPIGKANIKQKLRHVLNLHWHIDQWQKDCFNLPKHVFLSDISLYCINPTT